MTKITILADKITSRHDKIRKLLRPLRPSNRDVGCNIKEGKDDGGRVVAAHDGGGISSTQKWIFRTFVADVWAEYYELWLPSGNSKRLALQKAYLHLYRPDEKRGSLKEFVCVHCDPQEDENSPGGRYKKGPHLHIRAADKPLPKSHFPLNLGHLNEILESVDALTMAMGDAVQVLADEVLNKFN